MKRNRRASVLKLNTYYVVVIVGILALATMIAVDNLQGRKEQEIAKQKIEITEEKLERQETIHQTIGSKSQATTEQVIENNDPVEVSEPVVSVLPATKSTTAKETSQEYDGKTKLEWPLVGNVILPYSMDTTIYFQTLEQYKVNPGMMIQAAEGVEVTNPYQGKIVSVNEDSKFGVVVTVDIGNDFVIDYGQLKKDTVKFKKGDVIDAGMIIGQVDTPTDFFMLEGTHLYLEMRKNKKPVNPMEYLK